MLCCLISMKWAIYSANSPLSKMLLTERLINPSYLFLTSKLTKLTSSTQKLQLTSQDQSHIRTSLNNTLNALLNHITIFFSNPPPRELPSHLLSPNPQTAPSTPMTETPVQAVEANPEWSFLPSNSSALAACKWSLTILETLGKRLQDFLLWGEDTADTIRIAVGGVRERTIRAILVAWRDGYPYVGGG